MEFPTQITRGKYKWEIFHLNRTVLTFGADSFQSLIKAGFGTGPYGSVYAEGGRQEFIKCSYES